MRRPAAARAAVASVSAITEATAACSAAAKMAEGWRIIPRPLLETILNNHAQHHRVPQTLLLHGPRGVGKTSLLLHRLLPEWNKGPHIAAYVDFADSSVPRPWASFSATAAAGSAALPDLGTLCERLERELEALVDFGVRLGTISSHDVFTALNKWHGLETALRRVIGPGRVSRRDESPSVSTLWSKAVSTLSGRIGAAEIEAAEDKAMVAGHSRKYSMEDVAYMREARAALSLAKEVIGMHQKWRKEAVRHLNRTGGFSRSLANSATDWPCLLLQILSQAAEVDFFQVEQSCIVEFIH